MTNRESPSPERRHPLGIALSVLALVLGLLAVLIQGLRLATGAITYEGSVVSFIGGCMFATMGVMGLVLALRRR